jgi:hypothetical protein
MYMLLTCFWRRRVCSVNASMVARRSSSVRRSAACSSSVVFRCLPRFAVGDGLRDSRLHCGIEARRDFAGDTLLDRSDVHRRQPRQALVPDRIAKRMHQNGARQQGAAMKPNCGPEFHSR